jgi:hypothetical protein
VKGVNKLTNLAKKPNINFLNKIADKVKNLPGKYKAIGVVAASALALIGLTLGKAIHKDGRIDQKYDDRKQVLSNFSAIA